MYLDASHVIADVLLSFDAKSDDWVTAAAIGRAYPDHLVVGTRSSGMHVFDLTRDDTRLMAAVAMYTTLVDDLPASIKQFTVGQRVL